MQVLANIKKLISFFIFLYNIIKIIKTLDMSSIETNNKRRNIGSRQRKLIRSKYTYISPVSKTIVDNTSKNFVESIKTFKGSYEYRKVETCAKTIALDTLEKPNWDGLETILLKAIFVILIDKYDFPLMKPLKKYNRNQMIHQINNLWNKPSIDDIDACMICYDIITKETPTTTLLCNHTLCTNCFLKCCRHSGNRLLSNCPMCRSDIMPFTV
tara:strand:- start:725 stop:1363 length:639 start_codon:yes stop_codon:yes gene_type:complete